MLDTEAYINDQFGYREELVYWYSFLKMAVLEKSSSERVIIGQDGWLFLTEPNQIADYQGFLTYTEAEKQLWHYIFQGRKDWLAQRNIIYVLVIAPDKKSIYSEYYPSQYPVIHLHNTALDQMIEYLGRTTDVHVIDLRVPLLEYKANSGDAYLLYHKTDTHWNLLGGYLAYAYLINELRTYYPAIHLLDVDELVYEIVHGKFPQ